MASTSKLSLSPRNLLQFWKLLCSRTCWIQICLKRSKQLYSHRYSNVRYTSTFAWFWWWSHSYRLGRSLRCLLYSKGSSRKLTSWASSEPNSEGKSKTLPTKAQRLKMISKMRHLKGWSTQLQLSTRHSSNQYLPKSSSALFTSSASSWSPSTVK